VKRTFTASITREGDWYVARCLDVEVASQGKTEDEALRNLQEDLELYFTPPFAGALPDLRQIAVEIGAA
jgi:predicted RNase H-like HicB family nuclease